MSSNRFQKRTLVLAKVGVAALILALLAWYLRKIDVHAVMTAIAYADMRFIFLSLLMLVGVWLCRCSILWFVMNLGVKVPWKLAAVATMMGGMMDLVIPGRSGYVVRWGVMSLKTAATKGFAFSAIVSAVLLEGIVLVIFFLGAFILAPQMQDFTSSKITVAFEVLLGAIAVCFVASNWLEIQLNKTVLKKISAVPALFEITRRIKSPRNFLMGIGFPAMSWGLQVVIIRLLGVAFGIPLGVFESVILIFAVNLAILIPVVPGNVGTIQVVITTVLTRLHYDETSALAFSFVFHAVTALPVMLSGAVLSLFFPLSGKGHPAATDASSVDRSGGRA